MLTQTRSQPPSLLRPAAAKQASIGGRGNDTSFEQSMSNLAHSHIRENAPELMQHELGFQLLDRSPDDKRAVGIMGFRVGEELLYVPLFFLSGQLKGHELLYIKSKNQFRPLKEDWVQQIMSKQTRDLGEPTTRNSYSLGVRQPRLGDLSNPSFGKYASTIRPELLPGVAGLARQITEDTPWPKLDLGAFLKRADRSSAETLARTCIRFPKVAQALARHYDIAALLQDADAAHITRAGILGEKSAKRYPTQHGILDGLIPKQGSVQVLLSGSRGFNANPVSSDGDDLTDADRDKLLRDGYIVRDTRDENDKKLAYTVDTGLDLSNPDAPGVYEVLTKPGKLERCVVLPNPWSSKGRHAMVIVLREDDPRSYTTARRADVFVRNFPVGDPTADLGKFMAKLPEAKDLKNKGNFLLIGEHGDSTVPMEVSRYDSSPSEQDEIYVVWEHHCHMDMAGEPTWSRRRSPGMLYGVEKERDYRDDTRLHLTDNRLGMIRATGNDLYIPAGYRLIKLDDEDNGPSIPAGCGCGSEGKSEKKDEKPKPMKLVLGRNLDISQAIFTKMAALDISDKGGFIRIDDREIGGRPEAVAELVGKRGLGEDTALELLGQAKSAGRVRVFVKSALGALGMDQGGYNSLQASAPVAPAFPEPLTGQDPINNLAGAIYPQHEYIQSDTPASGQQPVYDPGKVPGPNYMDSQNLISASQTGQKEVLDASAIGSLLKSNGDQSIIEPELPTLRQALHCLGRLLFRFYWHGEEMTDRFGKADMPALEDSIRNVFEDLGDLVLELQTKSVGGFDDEGFVDIEDAAE